MVHELKILPEYFEAVVTGRKNFELRKDDRRYFVNDILLLREWTPENGYTGRTKSRFVEYILRDCPGLESGYCILGL